MNHVSTLVAASNDAESLRSSSWRQITPTLTISVAG